MLKKLIHSGHQAIRFAASRSAPTSRIRAVEGSASAEYAAELLLSGAALMQLTPNEARVIVSYMRPRRIAAGTTFIREGDAESNDFMLLVLAGEVSVETVTVRRAEPITVSVVGPGHVLGEIGLFDGGARSASCTATTEVQGAVLTRRALTKLTREDPLTAAKLLMALSQRMARRLRESGEKLRMYAQLTQAMQQELDRATQPGAPPVKPLAQRRA